MIYLKMWEGYDVDSWECAYSFQSESIEEIKKAILKAGYKDDSVWTDCKIEESSIVDDDLIVYVVEDDDDERSHVFISFNRERDMIYCGNFYGKSVDLDRVSDLISRWVECV